MTGPQANTPRRRVLGPRTALPFIAILIIAVALLTPESTGGRTGDARLSARLRGPQGASVVYELAHRLGWDVSQRLTDSVPESDTTAVQVILDPAIPLSELETHAVLERVRRGGALIYILGGGPMADSLGLKTFGAGSGTLVAEASDSCPDDEDNLFRDGLPFWPDRRTHILAIAWKTAPPAGAMPLATVRPIADLTAGETAAVAGFPLGQGRVAVATDADLLRNDVVRVCRWGAGVAAVRMLEYASGDAPGGGVRRRLVFDEYHQGFGEQPGTIKGIVRYLGRTASGHLVLQLAVAGLVLLFAMGPRLLVPRAVERIERRSPLEHVDALAQAYRAVGASRTATSRLLHGVRRRTEHANFARSGASSDDAFLTWAEQRAPARAADVALVRRALDTPLARRDLEGVGQALARLEVSLTHALSPSTSS